MERFVHEVAHGAGAGTPLGKLPPFVRLGSHDSTDIDNLYFLPSMPSFDDCKLFCDRHPDNRNIAVVEEGAIRYCYKGLPDELNNSVLRTYGLHAQEHPNPVTVRVRRIVPLKTVRAIRTILTQLTETQHRRRVKEALSSQDVALRQQALAEIDFTAVELDTNLWKTIAFQLGQANALVERRELYTKTEIADRFPELGDLLYRRTGCGTAAINEHRDRLLESMSKVYTRQLGDLNLFCFKNGPEVDFRSTENWNAFVVQCRGIVIDVRRERCVHYPFDKFFRVDEVPENREDLLPRDLPVEIVEKLDGSMVSVLEHDGRIVLAFKGSFDAHTTPEIVEIAKRTNLGALHYARYSYIFEAISPHTRYPQGYTLIDYGDREELALIGMRDKLTNELLPYSEVERHASTKGLASPRRFLGTLEQALAETKQDRSLEREGYVAMFLGGRQVKIKYSRYMHAIKTVNDLKTARAIKKHYRAPPSAKVAFDLLPDNVREVAERKWNEFRAVYDSMESFFRRLASEGCANLHYALDNLPTGLRSPFLRFVRGQNYRDKLERVAMAYYARGQRFDGSAVTEDSHAALRRYVRSDADERRAFWGYLDGKDREDIESYLARYQDCMQLFGQTRERCGSSISAAELGLLPGELRKPLLRFLGGHAYEKKLEKAVLKMHLKVR